LGAESCKGDYAHPKTRPPPALTCTRKVASLGPLAFGTNAYHLGVTPLTEREEATGSKIMFSLSQLFFFGITDMLGVDSCVFLIFTTKVDPAGRCGRGCGNPQRAG
jgi:hypothetical protein